MLLWVDHHDKAYAWAENRIFSINAETGGLQVVKVEEQPLGIKTEEVKDSGGRLFDSYTDAELMRLGVPQILIPLVRQLKKKDDLDGIENRLPREAFKLIRQIIPESRGESKNNFFIVGDAHQRIYRHKVVLSRCGINIRGRSKKLKINYRTTEETRKWAVKFLEGKDVDDLDGGIDQQKGYKSLLHGEYPQVRCFNSFAEEVQFIASYLHKLIKEGVDINTVCLAVRTNDFLKQYEAAFRERGINTYLIRRSVAEDRKAGGLRLATMHRVKGLEFDRVVISGVNDCILPYESAELASSDLTVRNEAEINERALLYVSATRAKREVMITCFGKPSRFLKKI